MPDNYSMKLNEPGAVNQQIAVIFISLQAIILKIKSRF